MIVTPIINLIFIFFRMAKRTVAVATKSWNRFWYELGDPTVLGLMRILVGGMLVYTHVIWGINLPAFFGTSGWHSPDVLAVIQADRIAPSFWWYVSDAWMVPVHWFCILILVLFWVGFATRITSVLSLVITVSYAYRAHMANFGLDQINAILCLYLCIGPSGAVLSVDRLLSLWKDRSRARRVGEDWHPFAVKPSSAANLAVRLAQVHFCVIYAYAGLSKLQGPAWWSGEAIGLVFANLEYQSMDMTWIAWYPWVGDLMTHSSIVWEVSFAALVWVRPIRPYVLMVGFLLHAGIGGMLGMWTFGLIMIFGHVAFWPQSAVRFAAALFPTAERLLGANLPRGSSVEVTPQLNSDAVPGLPAPVTSGLHPALLCVNRNIRQRLQCLNYFLERGFQCFATDNPAEAALVRRATGPSAVFVLGRGMPDDEIVAFQYAHNSQDDPQPLFLVLSSGQLKRLNGRVSGSGNCVLSGTVSLGMLRREIQATLGLPQDLRRVSSVSRTHRIGAGT